jgi:hypothetical protein
VKSRRRTLLLIAFLLLGAALLLFLTRTGGEFQWVGPDHIVRRSRLGWLGQWLGPVKPFLQLAREKIVGPSAIVTVLAFRLEWPGGPHLPEPPGLLRVETNSSGDTLLVVTNADSAFAWLTNTAQARVRSTLSTLSLDGHTAAVSSYESFPTPNGGPTLFAGLWANHLSQVRADGVHLSLYVVASERARATNSTAVLTNLATGARVRLPENGAALLISARTNQHGNAVGVLWRVKVNRRK